MSTHRFPVAGGTPWDDLLDDQPWFDPAIESDRQQDAIAADALAALVAVPPPWADVALERFGRVDLVDVEQLARPSPAPARVPIVARSPGLDDHDLSRLRRRKILNTALDEPTSVPYRREQLRLPPRAS